MDSEGSDARMCNGSKPPATVVVSKEMYADTKSLLPPARKGGLAGRRSRSLKRKVQWNDQKGNQLAEVLEFQPSDSSDSEDENGDACVCAIM